MLMDRICRGCGIQLSNEHDDVFCSSNCEMEFNLAEANATAVYRELDDRKEPILFNCDGSGPHEGFIIREMPLTGANYLALCRSCWNRELEWRKQRNAVLEEHRGPKWAAFRWPIPDWGDGKIHEQAA